MPTLKEHKVGSGMSIPIVLTKWFLSTKMPTRIGVYEIARQVGACGPWLLNFSYWDGEFWYWGDIHPNLAILHMEKSFVLYDDDGLIKSFQWRGLA
jgi:hypothetical protein